jgi:hypothetical protein
MPVIRYREAFGFCHGAIVRYPRGGDIMMAGRLGVTGSAPLTCSMDEATVVADIRILRIPPACR